VADLEKQIKEKAKEIDKILDAYLPEEKGHASTVMCAMNYSIHVGGKRLRPMMMREVYRMFGGREEEDVLNPFMAAIEMIHTYSLCHDDLPAMDNDMYRRGKKSTHAEFGEAMGILAGDALLNYAFETALTTFNKAGDDPEKMYRIAVALSTLAKKAGIYGMIGGQVVDIESERKEPGEVTMDTIEFIHENKTAAMIESSMMIGAILAGALPAEIDIVESIGSDVGLAFQIRDDILDITGTDETLGKPAGSDVINGKATYVSLAGLEKAREDVRILSERAIANLAGLGGSTGEAGVFLKDLILSLIERDR